MRLAGKTILITGAASGIGRAAALRVAGEGAIVVAADLDPAGEALIASIRAGGSRGAFIRCDVTREEDVRAACERVATDFGGLDVVINSAGILQGAFQQVEELEPATFQRVLDVNVRGTYLVCHFAAPLLRAGGVVLCLSSGGGVRGPSSSLAYGASKAAVHGFCMTLQEQLGARGIRVNVVCPGALDTPMKRQNLQDAARVQGRDPGAVLAEAALGDPDGVARVLAFLASGEADYVTGTVFTR
ncbi:MAG: family oxidoreductase [Armatimonadetes bacterium]|jgi:NAD(P)-dependent dehydrogenase (short-subunit alcohol dehydrogenase family)|nr:family oxidoreductase [Armatimonadota bacterium]